MDTPYALALATEALELGLKLLQTQWRKQSHTADYTDIRQIASDINNPDYVRRIADSYYRIGVCHVFLADRAAAHPFFMHALDLYRVLREYNSELQTLETLAYTEQQKQVAVDYCMQGLAIVEYANNLQLVSNLFLTTIHVYCLLSQYDQALLYAGQAEAVIERTGIYHNKGRA